MITRPLDLSARLAAPPRNFDALFYVNAGLLVLFFALFGSRFVLAPGLGVEFQLPAIAGANESAMPTTSKVTIVSAGQVFADKGLCDIPALQRFLEAEATRHKTPSLLIEVNGTVPTEVSMEISAMAARAGFRYVRMAATEPEGAAVK